MARWKKSKFRPIDVSEMSERQREGFIQGDDPREVWEESKERFPKTPGVDGIQLARTLRDAERVVGTRVPLPKFVGKEPEQTSLVTTFPDGRNFREAHLTFQPETIRAMKAGMICLKCLEPQAYANEDKHMPDCEGLALHGPRYMRKGRQIIDLAMELEHSTGTHVGPSKPIGEHMAEMELRAEQRRFRKKIEAGGSVGRRARRS